MKAKLRWDRKDMDVLEFELDGPVEPEELKSIIKELPPQSGADLLVVSGRGPIWLYAVIIHNYIHVYPAIAVYDPKLKGAVVVASHTKKYEVGDAINV